MSLEGNLHALKRTLRSRTLWQWILFGAGIYLLVRLLRPVPRAPVRHTFEPLHVTPVGEESEDGIDWTRFAYVQYVTDKEYLCNSLMMFESLHRLGSKADRVLLYPEQIELYPKVPTWESMFLRKAQDDYKAHIVPVRPQMTESGDGTWAESFTKLLAFKQTQYDRVLSLDSDATILKVRWTCIPNNRCKGPSDRPSNYSPWTSSSYCQITQWWRRMHTGFLIPTQFHQRFY
jgi:hypothetical protein